MNDVSQQNSETVRFLLRILYKSLLIHI